MTPALDDTIAALASPPGPALRGIVRISGPETAERVGSIFVPDDATAWRNARVAMRHGGQLRLSRCRSPLPAAVAFWPGGRSYTGQPVAEIHTVGSPPLLESILDELFALGVRPAQPGEFTLRAFLAGRIDLTQAEAVLGVIDASGRQELEESLRQLAGGVSQRLGPLRSDLLDLLADLEAGLDFVDEDIEFVSRDDLLSRVRRAREAIERLLLQAEGRMHSSDNRRVVLAGLPNAGKSTLFNALAGREVALVSPQSGTTRDWLSANVEWNNVAIELIDTAGWEESSESIGREAQRARSEQWDRADLVVWCVAADASQAESELDGKLRGVLLSQTQAFVPVITKADKLVVPPRGGLLESNDARRPPEGGTTNECGPPSLSSPPQSNALCVSAISHSGLDALRTEVARRLSSADGPARELIGSTAARCRDSLATAVEALGRAELETRANLGEELVAISIRNALDALGAILGVVYTDDILDRIFSRFCIGK